MKSAVTVIFSYRRAMQLELLLKTLFKHCVDILDVSDVVVLYKDDPKHSGSYETLGLDYQDVIFVKENNFKADLLKIVKDRKEILFLVDDSVFLSKFSLAECISVLRCSDDYIGFSLRLGKNCTDCYPMDCRQEIPDMTPVSNRILKYNWTSADLDFAYPLELSSSVYKKEDIIELLDNLSYDNPNYLEHGMFINLSRFEHKKPIVLCYYNSVCFSNPQNKVQAVNNNRSGNIDADYVLELFENGFRINDKPFDGFMPNGAHQLVSLLYMKDACCYYEGKENDGD